MKLLDSLLGKSSNPPKLAFAKKLICVSQNRYLLYSLKLINYLKLVNVVISVEGYIFINCKSGKVWEIASETLKIKGIKMAHAVTGTFDVIAYANFSNMDELAMMIEGIQSLEGVQRTHTAIAIPPRLI
jgi:DNA-binding Lrp family transcriptional regulator